MICCIGLFAGLFIGQALGGIWVFVAPAMGFLLGLALDMKVMGKMHRPDNIQMGESSQTDRELPACNPIDSDDT